MIAFDKLNLYRSEESDKMKENNDNIIENLKNMEIKKIGENSLKCKIYFVTGTRDDNRSPTYRAWRLFDKLGLVLSFYFYFICFFFLRHIFCF